ncbi:MAG: Rpn family recombination-promoting nuclease/putative transposase [Porcipelethomonas sp.]
MGGDDYGDLKQSISINIINFNMFYCPEYHSLFKVMETTHHEVLSEKCAIHFFELKKVNKDNRMELWLQLINAESEEELDMLKETNVSEIQKAVMIIHKMSDDEKIQEAARLREKALHDEATALGHARREGRAEGIAEERAKLEANLRALGLSEYMIRKALNKD